MQITAVLRHLPDGVSFSASLDAGVEAQSCCSDILPGILIETGIQMANNSDSGEQLI